MTKHGTPTQTSGSFIEFAAAVLRALPRDLQPELMVGWTKNGALLKRALQKTLLERAFFTEASCGFMAGALHACVFSVNPNVTLKEALDKLSELGYRMISANDILAVNAVAGSARMMDPISCGLNGEIKIIAIQKQVHPPISSGAKVRTTMPDLSQKKEWTKEAWAARRWGVRGTVKTHHDSHGLCYEVTHEDGTLGYYNPNELEVLA